VKSTRIRLAPSRSRARDERLVVWLDSCRGCCEDVLRLGKELSVMRDRAARDGRFDCSSGDGDGCLEFGSDSFMGSAATVSEISVAAFESGS